MTGEPPNVPHRDRPGQPPDVLVPPGTPGTPGTPDTLGAPGTFGAEGPGGAVPPYRDPASINVEPPAEDVPVAEPVAPMAPARRGLRDHQIKRTRTGGLWVAVTGAAVVLLLLLIFILQNGQQVQVSFFGGDGHLPLGVAMLLSAVAGALLVAFLGAARIVQLRLVARRHRGTDAAARR
jgi:putative membrane protein